MNAAKPFSKISIFLFLVIFTSMAVTIFSCKRKVRSDISLVLYGETKNKVFKDLDADSFAIVMKNTLLQKKNTLTNPKLITAFYEGRDYEPILILQHLPKQELKVLPEYLLKAADHGLEPQFFKADIINALVQKFYDKEAIKTKQEAYQDLADLELKIANVMINYSNALQFGILSPRRIYANYFIETKRPDSLTMKKIFAIANLKSFLDSIQPKDPQYIALQKALKDGTVAANPTKKESLRILKVNLERLRWKNKPAQDKYIIVNIADFRLDVIEKAKSVMNMKVCVGEGRNKDYTTDLKEYDETDLTKDRPFSRETPQLNSMIYSVQVNPIWNIPQSIATNEITKYAASDRYYLSNKNIDVYKDGQLIEDPETIDFSAPNAGKIYTFKQRPGHDNSLGKIKFLFKNNFSIYLHDTPAKAAFNQPMRAVSHGCVRVERPLDLARALFGEGEKYQTISKQMQNENPEAMDIALSPKVPVYLTYVTAWSDEQGVIQFRKDIYGLDNVLDGYLQRLNGLN